jgi:hypothetical protein
MLAPQREQERAEPVTHGKATEAVKRLKCSREDSPVLLQTDVEWTKDFSKGMETAHVRALEWQHTQSEGECRYVN